MHEFVSYNHEILPPSAINLSAISSAALYGKGIFTTSAVYDSKPFLWEKHWRRLIGNSLQIGIDISDFSQEIVEKSLFEIIEKNKLLNARLRLTFFDTSASSIWKAESKIKTGLLIQTADFPDLPKVFRLTVSPFQINSKSPLANIKSCNYLEHILALENAKSEGFDEAIRLNERGEIASACMANIFWIKGDNLFTPHLKTGCLAGTMREYLIESIKAESFEMIEAKANLESIFSADEVFLTSSGIGIKPVEKINDIKYNLKNSIKLKNSFL